MEAEDSYVSVGPEMHLLFLGTPPTSFRDWSTLHLSWEDTTFLENGAPEEAHFRALRDYFKKINK